MGSLAIIRIVGTERTILLSCSDRTAIQKRIWQHVLIANDGGPWRIAAETSEIVVAGLSIELSDAGL